MITLKTLQDNRGIKTVANLNPTSQAFIDICNDAVRELLEAPEGYWGTIVRMRLCGTNGCLIFPRIVGTVLAINLCDRPVQASNQWYDFLPLLPTDYCNDRKWNSNVAYTFTNNTPTLNQISPGTSVYMQVYRRSALDDGKTITFFGINGNGWPDSETITLGLGAGAVGYVRGTKLWQIIQRVHKDVTLDFVDAYQYRPTQADLIEMGHYQSNETDPSYLKAELRGNCGNNGYVTSSCCHSSVDILAKMSFVPMSSPLDMSQIDNIEAIKTMISALRAGEATDPQKYAQLKAVALKILGMQLENKMPIQQTTTDINPFNGIALAAHQAW